MSVASTISIESEGDDAETVAELFTHHYIPDRPPAPYSEDWTADVPEIGNNDTDPVEIPVMSL